MRSKRKKGAGKISTLCPKALEDIMSLTKRKEERDIKCDRPGKCLAGAAWWTVRNVGMEFRKEIEIGNVDLRDTFPDVIVEAMYLDETVGK